MNEDAAWNRIVDAVEAAFGLEEHGRLKRALVDAPELSESVQFITFNRNGTLLKLERVTGPAIIDRKTVGARRAGASLHYENVYDPSEESRKTLLYRQDGADWQPLDLDALGLA